MEKINILIAGDLHGHFKLLYDTIRKWEKVNNEKIALILQVGDMGIFPDPGKVDKATRKFAQKDPAELSFYKYYTGIDEAKEIFESEEFYPPDLFFIKGNHEDFEYLSSFKDDYPPVPVDYYKKMFYIPDGEVIEVEFGESIKIKIAGLGGIAYQNRASNLSPKYYYEYAVKKLLGYSEKIDILLTHDIPYNVFEDNTGSIEIMEIIQTLKPEFHFCGHLHIEGQRLNIDWTNSYILNQVNYSSYMNNSMGILQIIDAGIKEFSFLTEIGYST